MLLVSLLGFALNYTPWGITLNSIMVAVAIVITLNSVYSALRLRAVPSDKITHPGGIINTQSRSPILSTVMLVSIIGVISTSIVFLASEKSEDTFTSFFVASSPEGNVAFPKDLVVGQEISVYLVLSNHEGKNCTYDVQQALNGKSNKIGSNILLANGETWNQSVKLRFVSQGPDQKVEFALYKNGQSYLNPVYLWFNIKAP
jgi:uncharacterized membrane protein